MQRIFVTGIGTEVGKTLVAATVTEALQADYWKPIQAGDLDYSDTHKIKQYISNQKTLCHPNAFALKTPMSPHAAADIDRLVIKSVDCKTPRTKNHFMVVEGAGGILVPINSYETILDLIEPSDKVLVVSRHYLGSINHTLMTLKILNQYSLDIALVFNGSKHLSTETAILYRNPIPVIGRLETESYFDKNIIQKYACLWKVNLKKWLYEPS